MSELKGQKCPVCGESKLTLTEEDYEVPHFGKCFLMSMVCEACHYHASDVESEQNKGPIKITFEVKNENDLKVRVIKSSEASVKIPQMRMSVEPGSGSNGFITNIEGLLNRFKKIIESERDNAEDASVRKKAKNLLKKLWKVELGELPLKIIIEDPSGNSAIVSDKTEAKKL